MKTPFVTKDQLEAIAAQYPTPFHIYDEKGIVRYSCNINFRNTPMAKMIEEKTGIKKVRLSNDAKNYQSEGKSTEISRFQCFLVEISGIEPLTS